RAGGACRATFLLRAPGSAVMAGSALAPRDLSVLTSATPSASAYSAGAGIVHFFVGWTCLGLSQQQVGAATTGAVLASTPLVGSVLAALTLGEPLTPLMAAGILMAAGGVALLSLRRSSGVERTFPWFAVGAALSWGSSPLLIRWGLEGLPDRKAHV